MREREEGIGGGGEGLVYRHCWWVFSRELQERDLSPLISDAISALAEQS